MRRERGRLRLFHGDLLTRGLHVAVGNIKGSEDPNYFLGMNSLCLNLAKLSLVSRMCLCLFPMFGLS